MTLYDFLMSRRFQKQFLLLFGEWFFGVVCSSLTGEFKVFPINREPYERL